MRLMFFPRVTRLAFQQTAASTTSRMSDSFAVPPLDVSETSSERTDVFDRTYRYPYVHVYLHMQQVMAEYLKRTRRVLGTVCTGNVDGIPLFTVWVKGIQGHDEDDYEDRIRGLGMPGHEQSRIKERRLENADSFWKIYDEGCDGDLDLPPKPEKTTIMIPKEEGDATPLHSFLRVINGSVRRTYIVE